MFMGSDFALEAFTGTILPASEYSFIASARNCFVWKHTQSVLVGPTCYIFPCPFDDGDVASTPFGALVSYGATREPGLLLLSKGGELRLWDSIGLGLTGTEYTDASSLSLQLGEVVTGLINTDVRHFMNISTISLADFF
jgi:nuclear pore complex protein Nup133